MNGAARYMATVAKGIDLTNSLNKYFLRTWAKGSESQDGVKALVLHASYPNDIMWSFEHNLI